MAGRGTTLAIGLLCLAAAAGCGRKAVPVYPRAEGAPAASVVPDAAGTARLPKAAPLSTDLSVAPTEITANPNGPKRRFPLDGLLN